MKKLVLSTIVASAFTISSASASQQEYVLSKNLFENGYNSIGIERVDFRTDQDGSLGEANMFSLRRGYDLSRYISFSLGVSLPIDNKVINTYQNTFYEGYDIFEEDGELTIEYDDLIVQEYTNEIKPSAIIGADIKLSLPIHPRVTGFITGGFSYTRMKHTGYFMENINTGERFDRIVDFLPADIFLGLEPCEITGGSLEQAGCDFEIMPFADRYNSFGYSYGAGVNFNINRNSSFVVQYKKYNYSERLNPEGIYIGYQWRF